MLLRKIQVLLWGRICGVDVFGEFYRIRSGLGLFSNKNVFHAQS